MYNSRKLYLSEQNGVLTFQPKERWDKSNGGTPTDLRRLLQEAQTNLCTPTDNVRLRRRITRYCLS